MLDLLLSVADQPTVCAPRPAIVAALARQYGERAVAAGLNDAGAVVEILVSPAGTWTALASLPDGTSCVIGAGTGWEAMTPPVAGRAL